MTPSTAPGIPRRSQTSSRTLAASAELTSPCFGAIDAFPVVLSLLAGCGPQLSCPRVLGAREPTTARKGLVRRNGPRYDPRHDLRGRRSLRHLLTTGEAPPDRTGGALGSTSSRPFFWLERSAT